MCEMGQYANYTGISNSKGLNHEHGLLTLKQLSQYFFKCYINYELVFA